MRCYRTPLKKPKIEIKSIMNYCFAEIFNHGPKDLHLSAFFLHPLKYRHLSILKVLKFSFKVYFKSSVLWKPDLNSTATILNSSLFKQVGDCVGNLLEIEVRYGSHQLLKVKSTAEMKVVKDTFVNQFKNYALQQWPFTTVMWQGMTVLEWWENLQNSNNASVLAVKYLSL